MKEELAVLIFYSFLVGTFAVSYTMLDKHTQGPASGTYHGRYTRDIRDPELLIPRRVAEDGSFLTFTLPNFYDRQELEARKKRAADANANTGAAADADTVDDDLADHRLHLVLPFNGANHHVELTPHHEFISPDMVVETRGEGALTDLNNGVRFKRVPDLQCHYRGRVRGHDNSRAALSLCEGVAGYVQTDQGRFFIEPVGETEPDEEGQHIHMVYKRRAPHEDSHDSQRKKRNCGTNDDWETAWAEQIEKKNRRERLAGGNETLLKRAPESASTHSLHRYLELALFCDKRFLEYHKGKDYEQYLLTIMNMVSDYYHDWSIGNQMDVVVVRIVYLEKQEKEIDLFISPEAEKTLDSFAAWQDKMNPKDTKHPNHHDVGVLITRYDICAADEAACNLMGLAYVAAACDAPKAACINEDDGLLLGIVITHEVGHTLGSGHDQPDISGCEPQDNDKSYFIMSPIVSIFTLRWSPCSRKFVTTFVETLGDCLTDNPKKPNEKYKLPGMLPGAMYDGAFQCNLKYPGSSLCDRGEEICTALWCKTTQKPQVCTSSGASAEGTKCAENKWCIHQKCVEIGKRPAAVHGGWGSWGDMSECSRTCGGGIRVTERECDKPIPKDGGRYCLGERKKYSTCNTNPCDESKPSYRAIQCSEYDDKKVLADNLLHTWKPKTLGKDNPCVLYCLNEKNTYVKLAPMVKDGTPCEAGTKNMCISGMCRIVGCDWVVDGDSVEDQCGICKGDGTQCTPVEGDFTASGKSDYQKVVTVPKGSRNIKFFEKGPAENCLAIKFEKGDKYILNGNHTEQRDGEYPCAGDIAMYNHPEPQREDVVIKGPIEEDIQLQYTFYNPKVNPGIHYVYYIRSARALGSTPQYLWDFLAWGPCSAKCGGGTQLAEASCVEHLSGKVGNSFCKDIPRPEPKSRICDSEICGAKWRVSQWSRCSGCGGKQGKQRRKVQCVRPAARAGGDDVQAELSACKGKSPKQSQPCTGSEACKKKCSKKTRSNTSDEQSDSSSEKRPSLEEQRNIIDKLVDMGMTRYLEKPNAANVEVRSEKRNVAADFKHLIDDWVAPSNDVGLDGERDCPGAPTKGYTTQKPGAVVKDSIPSGSIVLMEAPYLDGIKQSNMSDQAFQEDGDSISVELDTNKMKIYKGAEAANQIHMASSNDLAPVSKSTAGAKSSKTNKSC